jgi:hypothetical protein
VSSLESMESPREVRRAQWNVELALLLLRGALERAPQVGLHLAVVTGPIFTPPPVGRLKLGVLRRLGAPPPKSTYSHAPGVDFTGRVLPPPPRPPSSAASDPVCDSVSPFLPESWLSSSPGLPIPCRSPILGEGVLESLLQASSAGDDGMFLPLALFKGLRVFLEGIKGHPTYMGSPSDLPALLECSPTCASLKQR